jgi:type IV secretion system protein VirB2
MAAGGTLVFGGELNEFARRSCIAVLAIAFLVAGSSFMSMLFNVTGALI